MRNKVWGMSEGSRALISSWVHYDPPDKNFACKPRMLPNSQAYYPPGKNFGHQAKNCQKGKNLLARQGKTAQNCSLPSQ